MKPATVLRAHFSKALLLGIFIGVWGECWGQYAVDFEGPGETKGFYASGSVTLSGLDWDFTQALIGIDAEDWKNGLRSARLRGYGSSAITMTENKLNGAASISFSYRGYSSDNQVEWVVEYSINSGSSWLQAGSAFTSPPDNVVQSFSATVNQPGPIRFRIRTTSSTGTSNRRLNLDDIIITDYISTCLSAPASGPTSFAASGISSGDFNFSWNDVAGFNSLTVISEGTFVSGVPSDGISYSPSPVFGAGDPLGGGFINFTSQGGSSAMSGANPGSIYNVDIYSFCDNGYLYNTASSLSGQVLTEPANPSFNPLCSSSTEIVLQWDDPTSGSWDGFVILGREGAAPTTINLVAPSTLMPNLNFGLAPTIGVNSILYEGNDNTATITGLTPGSSYTFRILAYGECASCINSFEYSTGTQITGVAELNDVVNFSSTAQATSVELGWNFSVGCADEIIVVASETPITGTPTGSYTVSSSSFTDVSNPILNSGEFVVYSGLGNTVTVTNLTTDTEYCFKAFLRRGSEWSDGVSVCETASATTIFEPGDLSIVAINASAQFPQEDEVCFIAYRTISTGTTIDLTDNGYERLTAGLWADTEGVIRLERTGAAIAPGTTICMLGSGDSDAELSVLTCGTDDGGWTITSLNGTSDFALNAADQVWIMQGGNWINPAGSHDAQYTGNVLYGWTAVGWQSSPGYNNTSGSTLFPNSNCLSTNLQTLTEGDRVKYTGPTVPTTKTGFIQLINDAANWTGYATDASYFSTSPLYSDQPCITFDILPFIPTPGEWVGAVSNDWFDCLNWEDLRLPTASVDVNIPSSAANDLIISNHGAECNDLNINNGASIELGSASASLAINGDVILDGIFNGINGTVNFVGNDDQFLTSDPFGMGASILFAHDLIADKPGGRIIVEGPVQIDGELSLQSGVLDLTTPEALIRLMPTSSLAAGSGNASSFIHGPIEQSGLNASTVYTIPSGDYAPGLSVYQPARLISSTTISSSWTVQYFHENFNTFFPNPLDPPRTPDLNVVSTCNYWTIDRDGSDNVRVGLSWNEDNCFEVTDPDALKVARYSDIAMEWEDAPFTPGVSQTNSGGPDFVSGWVTTTQTVNTFSPFAIGSIGNDLNVLPITLLSFTAEAIAKNLVETRWSTASETNNDYFTVERSQDGGLWEPVGIEIGAGTSNTQRDYRMDDDAPYPGLSYYRLKQTDFDGSFAYSHVVPVNMGDFSGDFDLINAYRDGDKLALLYTAERPQIRVEIFSVVGQRILARDLENTEGFARIDLPQLAHGAYVVRISTNTESASGKFFF